MPEKKKKTFTSRDARNCIIVPSDLDHKYSRGVLGVITGSAQYPGAAVLTTAAASATGLGMIRFHSSSGLAHLVLHTCPEVVVQPEHLEMELSVEINGVNFFGKVDRFTVDGVNRVTDYKTGKSPGKFVDDKLAQPYLYALGFKTQHDIDVDEVELIFLNAQEVVRRQADSGLVISQGEKLAQMRAGSESDVQSSSWEARVSRLCDYCAFERVCPARTPEAPVPGSTECDTKLSEAGLLHK